MAAFKYEENTVIRYSKKKDIVGSWKDVVSSLWVYSVGTPSVYVYTVTLGNSSRTAT